METVSSELVMQQCLRAYRRSAGETAPQPEPSLTTMNGDRLTLADETGPLVCYQFVREQFGIRIHRANLEN